MVEDHTAHRIYNSVKVVAAITGGYLLNGNCLTVDAKPNFLLRHAPTDSFYQQWHHNPIHGLNVYLNMRYSRSVRTFLWRNICRGVFWSLCQRQVEDSSVDRTSLSGLSPVHVTRWPWPVHVSWTEQQIQPNLSLYCVSLPGIETKVQACKLKDKKKCWLAITEKLHISHIIFSRLATALVVEGEK